MVPFVLMKTKFTILGLLGVVIFALLIWQSKRINFGTEGASVSGPSKKDLNADGPAESHTQSKKVERSLEDKQTWEELVKLQKEASANIDKEWALLSERDPKIKELRAITKNFQRYLQDKIRDDSESLFFWRESEENRELMERYRVFSLIEAFSVMQADEFWEPYMDDYYSVMLEKHRIHAQESQVSGKRSKMRPWTRPTWDVDKAVLETMRDATQLSSQSSEELQSGIPADIVVFLDDVLSHRLAYEAASYLLNKEKTTAIRNAEDKFYALSAQLDELAERSEKD